MTVRQVLCSLALPALVILTIPGRPAAGADWPNYRGPDHNGKGKCGYATPVPFTVDGQPCLAIMSEVTLFAVRQTDGKQLWQFPWRTMYEINAAGPEEGFARQDKT